MQLMGYARDTVHEAMALLRREKQSDRATGGLCYASVPTGTQPLCARMHPDMYGSMAPVLIASMLLYSL